MKDHIQQLLPHGAVPNIREMTLATRQPMGRDRDVQEDPLRSELSLEMCSRMEVLHRKAKADRLDIPEEVLYYIASQIIPSNHELQSALVRVVAYASIINQDLSVHLAAQALDLDGLLDPPVSTFNSTTKANAAENNESLHRRDRRKTKNASDSTLNIRNVALGIFEGVIMSVAASAAMIICCLVIDVLSHRMRILTPATPWLWWTIIGLNALTALIPFDMYRFRKSKSNPTVRSRASLSTYFLLELTVVMVFLVLLFRFQTADIQVLQALGLLR